MLLQVAFTTLVARTYERADNRVGALTRAKKLDTFLRQFDPIFDQFPKLCKLRVVADQDCTHQPVVFYDTLFIISFGLIDKEDLFETFCVGRDLGCTDRAKTQAFEFQYVCEYRSFVYALT